MENKFICSLNQVETRLKLILARYYNVPDITTVYVGGISAVCKIQAWGFAGKKIILCKVRAYKPGASEVNALWSKIRSSVNKWTVFKWDVLIFLTFRDTITWLCLAGPHTSVFWRHVSWCWINVFSQMWWLSQFTASLLLPTTHWHIQETFLLVGITSSH